MTKSHTVQKTEGLEYYGGEEEEGEKRGGGVFVSAPHCAWVCKPVGQKVAYLEYQRDRLRLVQQVWGRGDGGEGQS